MRRIILIPAMLVGLALSAMACREKPKPSTTPARPQASAPIEMFSPSSRLEGLIERARSDDQVRATEAVRALRAMGARAAPAVPVLIERLRDQDSPTDLRRAILDALSGIGPAAAAAVPEVTDQLNDEDRIVRSEAVRVLRDLGPAAKGAIDAMVRVSKEDEDPMVRKDAEQALAWIRPPSPELVEKISRDLKTHRAGLASAFNRALREYGPRAVSKTVPVLLEFLEGPDRFQALGAVRSLRKIGPVDPRIVPALIKALDHESLNVCGETAELLGEFGPAARDAIPALIRASKDERSAGVRSAAVRALAKIDQQKPAIP